MPGFMVISCGLEGELDCHGFGDLSNAAVGALFYAVQTRRALFINTGKPHVYDFLESSQLEWGFVGAVAECAMNGAPKLKKSESPLIRFTDESKGDTAFGQTFPLSSWLDFFWLHLGLFHRDITLNEGVLLPPALVITSYNVLSEYRFMLAFYGEPRVSMSVSKDDYRYVFTYGCLLRTLFERPTQKMYKHVAEPMEIMTRADVSVAVHIRFGDALMDKDISEFIPGPADRRVKVDRSGVDPYCVCGWNFVEQTLRGKTIVDKRDTVISDSTTEFKAFDSSSDGALDIAVFTLADSSRGVKLIKDYFLEKHARSAVWNPIAAKKFTDKDFGKGGKWMPDDKTTQTQHNTSKDQESKQSNVLVFNTAGAPKHVAVDTDMESDIKAMADWLIASSADFVVTSRSGFSFSASAKSLHPAVTLFQCWIHNFYLH
ncbi:hypothetical protein SARC_02685 [Sphaeroforma arctica JP610]|uniref:Uncharacterized protein n=1 Tax=Sphaeroforma arctica JP610 TaxID=667725 RepID=A0A0L0G817_9EUKA|nr:hypothetical protein SARC_02685 [Sphaeroforma arctica JP610]KNC85130.1 hypothetical protein SARC_02685 [Sphaeroforma arctica JP610]|eukprot:XP_014159032.1 hypothetical protein SARC_02685 [Sphaeroforma arctica JP610]